MRHLPFDVNKSIGNNEITQTIAPPSLSGSQARVFHLNFGIFHANTVTITSGGNDLVENIDYIVTGYSKHFKHNFNLDGYGLIALINQTDYSDLEVTAHFVGGDYVIYQSKDIPTHVPMVGNGISQILWDNVVDGPMVDSRTLSGVYPEDTSTPMSAISAVIGALSEQYKADGVPEDKAQVRRKAIDMSVDKLAKVPGGLNTEADDVVEAINELKQRIDELQYETQFIGIILDDAALTNDGIDAASGWIVGKDGVTVTARFHDGDSSKELNAGVTVTYIPETMMFYVDETPTDYKLIKQSWFDKDMPDGYKNLLDGGVAKFAQEELKLFPSHMRYGGPISAIRENTTINDSGHPSDQTYQSVHVVAEEGLTVRYWSGVRYETETPDLGTVYVYENVTRTVKRYDEIANGIEPLIDQGVNVIDFINELLESIDDVIPNVGHLLTTLRPLPSDKAIRLGMEGDVSEHADLYHITGKLLGTPSAEGKFKVPGDEHGYYPNFVSIETDTNHIRIYDFTKYLPHPKFKHRGFQVNAFGESAKDNYWYVHPGNHHSKTAINGYKSLTIDYDNNRALHLTKTNKLAAAAVDGGQYVELATVPADAHFIVEIDDTHFLIWGTNLQVWDGSTLSTIGAAPSLNVSDIIGTYSSGKVLIVTDEGDLHRLDTTDGSIETLSTSIPNPGRCIFGRASAKGKILMTNSGDGKVYLFGDDLTVAPQVLFTALPGIRGIFGTCGLSNHLYYGFEGGRMCVVLGGLVPSYVITKG